MTTTPAKKSQRTDAHRPGIIVPADYEYQVCYSLPRGAFIPAINVDCTMPVPSAWNEHGSPTHWITPTCPNTGRCCARSAHREAERRGDEIFGYLGKCGVCGACYSYGVVFLHKPSGALVHMGHDCADKYEAMYDLSAWELQNRRAEKASAVQVDRTRRTEAREAFLAAHAGLAEDLALGEPSATGGRAILADMARRFTQFCSLSDKQVAFARKLAEEIRNPPPPKPEERRAVAPTGKGVEFEGDVVSAKICEGDWGATWKVTVKIETAEGSWLAYGTAPRALMDGVVTCVDAQEADRRRAWSAAQKDAVAANPEHEVPSYSHVDRERLIRDGLRGLRVSVRSTLERPRQVDPSTLETDAARATAERRNGETHFVFMSRPSMSIATYRPGRAEYLAATKPKRASKAKSAVKSAESALAA
jgi:hypothetical protein